MQLADDEVLLDPQSAPGLAQDEVLLDSYRRRTPLQALGRQAGLTARAGIEGVAALPLAVAGAPVQIKRSLGYPSGLTPAEGLSKGLTAIGLPEPENAGERLVQDVAGGMAGTGAVSGAARLPVALGALVSGGVASGAGGAVREAGGPPWAQSLASLATGIRPGAKITAESIRNPANIERMKTWEAANKAGYKFPPSTIERSAGRETLESLAGKAALKQEFSQHNAQISRDIAKKEAGIPSHEPINEETLAAARYELAAPYREVAGISPKANKALEDWRQAKAEAKLHYNDYERNKTVTAFKAYERKDREAASALQRIEAEAIAAGRKDLLPQLRAANIAIAKNWDVDKALNIGTGEVRADVLGRELNKRGEKAMTGGLGLIARTQQAFPDYMRGTDKAGGGVVSHLRPYASLLGGVEGYNLGGWPGAALGVSAPWLMTGARGMAQSPSMQRPLHAVPIPLAALIQSEAMRERPDSGQ